MGFWKKIIGAKRTEPAPWTPAGPPDARAYVVGDVHGRLDRLDALLAMIDRDRAEQPERRTLIAFLGDYIDRGPHSAGVIDRLAKYVPADAEALFLAGNHEDALLQVLQGAPGMLRNWLRFGGDACARSYGVDEDRLVAAGELVGARMLGEAIPEAHHRFLRNLRDRWVFGDYLFVHAGIRPGIRLDAQIPADLLWIREPFLSARHAHGMMVVHGHTIVDAAEEHANRIAIDTGAFRSGRLTALVIEDDRRRFLVTDPD
ncbi:metallophosphoesterase family protein [Sphingomonas jatrophae]|uniref:Serine/threonine protein phosphatase 1 n=1 Tax=Sphingomonas jatrophae TaxID=1166337 RepID=A0A1I6L5X9_9SPHN|nr:metallophosphoesterase family protein [Sphingomonas jatrophae]SFR98832.1 serine/threonine protein phosphatase 1 [Sphingomonas jatrophae]